MRTEAILDLPLRTLAERLASGAVRATEVAEAVTLRFAADGTGLTFADAAFLLRGARALEEHRVRGRALGTLHGLPLVVDDRITVAFVPAAWPVAGGAGERDSAIVARLRAAGALLAGKTEPDAVAAVVARRATALGVGIDADGALHVAAGRAGVVAHRPTAGAVALGGVTGAGTLGAPVVVATELAAAARAADALYAGEGPAPGLAAAARGRPPLPPEIGVVDDAALGAVRDVLGDRGFSFPLPPPFAEAPVQARRVVAADTAHAFAAIRRRRPEALGAVAALVEEGAALAATDYLAALDWRTVIGAGLDALFERCDAVVLADPTLGAFCGLPTVTLPLLAAEDGTGIGVHLVARRGDDARLVRTAAWLLARVLEPEAA